MILISAALVGLESAVFHPEASRIAHMAAGQRRGLAQSLFQVGGNAGTSLGTVAGGTYRSGPWPGTHRVVSLVAFLGVVVLWKNRRLAEQELPPYPSPIGARCRRAFSLPRAKVCNRPGSARDAGLLEVRLPDESDQLLHVLSHG